MSSEEPEGEVFRVLDNDPGVGLSQSLRLTRPTPICLARLMNKARQQMKFHDTFEDTLGRNSKFAYFYPHWVQTYVARGFCMFNNGRVDIMGGLSFALRVVDKEIILCRLFNVKGETRSKFISKTKHAVRPVWIRIQLGSQKFAECRIRGAGPPPFPSPSMAYCHINLETGEII